MYGNMFKIDLHSQRFCDDDGSISEKESVFEAKETSKAQKQKELAKTNFTTDFKPNTHEKMEIDDSVLSKETQDRENGTNMAEVLDQSLHSCDIETIRWILDQTDEAMIQETVKSIKPASIPKLIEQALIRY